MTYPATAFLEGKDFTRKSILEWGSGQSTLWWATRAARVVSFESDREWFDRVEKGISKNVTLELVDDDLTRLPAWLFGMKFDLIVVDGLNRFLCARVSQQLLAEGGAIILDDAEQFYAPYGDNRHVIVDFMRENGFSRADFFGHAPAVIRRHCTSVFFKSKCFLFAGEENPANYDQ
jgi:predicted O-methyltransferase YrrM